MVTQEVANGVVESAIFVACRLRMGPRIWTKGRSFAGGGKKTGTVAAASPTARPAGVRSSRLDAASQLSVTQTVTGQGFRGGSTEYRETGVTSFFVGQISATQATD